MDLPSASKMVSELRSYRAEQPVLQNSGMDTREVDNFPGGNTCAVLALSGRKGNPANIPWCVDVAVVALGNVIVTGGLAALMLVRVDACAGVM